MSESRLFQILYYLLSKGEATAAELAEKFEVSIRTIYRDIDRLSGAGIPVYTTTGYKGGVHIDEDFVLKKSLLSKEDMQNILMGMQSLSAIGFSQQDACLTKLQGLFQMQEADWMEVDYSRWGCDSESEKKTFGLLREAIQQKRQVHFEYYNSSGEASDRDCRPIKLLFKDRAWYLQAYCLKRNAERLFRLSRIRNLKMSDRCLKNIPEESPASALPKTTPPEAGESETVFSETVSAETKSSRVVSPGTVSPKTARIIEMELRFAKKVAHRIFDDFDESMIVETEEGLIVKAAMPEDEWLYGFLMSFGDSLTILSPMYLRYELIKRYQSALQHFMNT